MKKIIFSLLFVSSFLSADWMLNTSYICVNSYYVVPSSGTLYYTRSDTNATLSTTTKSLVDDLIDGYQWNKTTLRCEPIPPNNNIGLRNMDYNYLMALLGLLIGFAFLFSLQLIFSRK